MARSLKAVPALITGEMEKAIMMIHTSTPPRPKPLRKPEPEPDAKAGAAGQAGQNC